MLRVDEYGRHELPKKAEYVYGKPGTAVETEDVTSAETRPDISQKGAPMIGDSLTGALHRALKEAAIDDHTLLALLILALAGKNVSVRSGGDMGADDRQAIAKTITDGGVLTPTTPC